MDSKHSPLEEKSSLDEKLSPYENFENKNILDKRVTFYCFGKELKLSVRLYGILRFEVFKTILESLYRENKDFEIDIPYEESDFKDLLSRMQRKSIIYPKDLNYSIGLYTCRDIADRYGLDTYLINDAKTRVRNWIQKNIISEFFNKDNYILDNRKIFDNCNFIRRYADTEDDIIIVFPKLTYPFKDPNEVDDLRITTDLVVCNNKYASCYRCRFNDGEFDGYFILNEKTFADAYDIRRNYLDNLVMNNLFNL